MTIWHLRCFDILFLALRSLEMTLFFLHDPLDVHLFFSRLISGASGVLTDPPRVFLSRSTFPYAPLPPRVKRRIFFRPTFFGCLLPSPRRLLTSCFTSFFFASTFVISACLTPGWQRRHCVNLRQPSHSGPLCLIRCPLYAHIFSLTLSQCDAAECKYFRLLPRFFLSWPFPLLSCRSPRVVARSCRFGWIPHFQVGFSPPAHDHSFADWQVSQSLPRHRRFCSADAFAIGSTICQRRLLIASPLAPSAKVVFDTW